LSLEKSEVKREYMVVGKLYPFVIEKFEYPKIPRLCRFLATLEGKVYFFKFW
jgi:hypothetical protein